MNIYKTILLGIITFAASGYGANGDALLDLLVKKGILTEAEVQAVEAEIAADAPVAMKAQGKETVELRFNGRLQGQFDGLSMQENGSDKPSTSHFYFRRLFLGAKAKLQNGVYAETVLDFARDGDEGDYAVNFDKAYIGYKFNNGVTGMLGFLKVPFGFEDTTSSSKLPTIERSAANRFFADDIDFSSRHTGLHIKGDLEGGFSYAAALVNGAQGEGSRLLGSAEANNDMAVFGRLQWANDDLTLGLDAGTQSNNMTEDANKVAINQDVTAYTAYVNYKLNDLNLLGEYFNGDLGSYGDVSGYALRASYKMDKLEPVIRYSVLKADRYLIDTDELIRRAPKGGTVSGTDNEIESFYLGLNYYYSKAVTFMAGYENAEAENGAGTDTAEVDGFRARVQVLW
ncbi:MAG: porin [Verrucomicrobia bacterium]|nr:porin [Verrucomicrobiota bacterium]